MMYFYNIHNKNAILEEGLGIESRDGSPATGWDLWTEMMRYPDRFEPEYFKYYSCVATIDCETPGEAFTITHDEESFDNNYYGKVTPLTGSGGVPSMSVGDIVLFNGEFWMCNTVGWSNLIELNKKRAESMTKTEALMADWKIIKRRTANVVSLKKQESGLKKFLNHLVATVGVHDEI